ncbi:DsbA family protein [Massilia sp. W12]|uniref:2-hydroxychromene-2-carboxylate isomerase n=1 Tax=Massilia sp. W12 TaxID=3126507 RepID=UPI0030CBB730
MTSETVDFWFDVISPYAWLAAHELPRLQQAGLQIRARPVLFAALLNAHGNLGPAEIPAKRAHLAHDVLHRATMRGLNFQGPPHHPFNPLLALRMCCAQSDDAQRLTLATRLMRAAWEEGADLEQPAQLQALAAACGQDGAALLAAAASAAVKQSLQANAEAALAAGVFGVPTLEWRGELFWGADRIEHMLWRQAGHRPDLERIPTILARPASARRKP